MNEVDMLKIQEDINKSQALLQKALDSLNQKDGLKKAKEYFKFATGLLSNATMRIENEKF